jgi:hypothetical protein
LLNKSRLQNKMGGVLRKKKGDRIGCSGWFYLPILPQQIRHRGSECMLNIVVWWEFWHQQEKRFLLFLWWTGQYQWNALELQPKIWHINSTNFINEVISAHSHEVQSLPPHTQ